MWLILLFVLINLPIGFVGNKILKVPGFDITMIAIIILARAGENILLSAIILTVAFSFFSINRLKYLWLTVPATILVGYLSLVIPGVFMLFIIYHLVCLLCAFLIGFFGPRYIFFVMVNLGINLAIARIYTLFS